MPQPHRVAVNNGQLGQETNPLVISLDEVFFRLLIEVVGGFVGAAEAQIKLLPQPPPLPHGKADLLQADQIGDGFQQLFYQQMPSFLPAVLTIAEVDGGDAQNRHD